MKYFIKLLILVFTTCILISCTSFQDKQFTSSKLELRQLVKEVSTTHTAHGWFFLVSGSYSASETEKTTVKVMAKVEGRYKFMEMPIESIRIVINNNISIPYIEIEYVNTKKYSDEALTNNIYLAKTYIITCQEQYLPEKLLPITLQ